MSFAIDSNVLVLNRSYQAISARPLRRALKKLCTSYDGDVLPKAMILDPVTYETWTWADWSVAKKCAPEIIVLSRYNDTPQHKIPFSRRAIYKRDHFTCQFCGSQPGPEELTIDHVQPRSRGGISSWENCVLACIECNKRKANRTPAEAGMKLRHVPKRPNFMPIFGSRTSGQFPKSWRRFIAQEYWDVELQP